MAEDLSTGLQCEKSVCPEAAPKTVKSLVQKRVRTSSSRKDLDSGSKKAKVGADVKRITMDYVVLLACVLLGRNKTWFHLKGRRSG